MSMTPEGLAKVAMLARLNISEHDLDSYTQKINDVLMLIDQMNQVDTQSIEPLAHPLELHQRLREDAVTETNERDAFQALAPEAYAGLYLVPQVIE